MEISVKSIDWQQWLLNVILAGVGPVFLLFILSWNIVAIVACLILGVFLCFTLYVDWSYLSRKIILEEGGCSFVSARRIKKYSWEEIYLQYVENSYGLFLDEFSGKGLILSGKPISKPEFIGAMTYCRLAHPIDSVFIRFESSVDDPKKIYWKSAYRGFVADKNQILEFLNSVGKTVRKL